MASPHASPQLARALAARLRDAVQADDRLASFVFNGGTEHEPSRSGLGDGEELAVAHDFVLRVFHGASDPLNNRILTAAVGDGAEIDGLCAELDLVRMALLERVNDLVQLGLVARDLQRDSVHATPAGEGIVQLVWELEIEVAEWLRHRKRK